MKQKIQIRNNKILLILAGLLISFGLSFSLCNPAVTTKTVPNSELVQYGHGWEHIGENQKTVYFLRDNVCFKYFFSEENQMHSWNYREFYISNMNSYDTVHAEVVFYDAAGNEIARSQETWGNGYNLVSNPVGTFRAIYVRFYNHENASFTLEGMRLLETLPYMAKKKTAGCMVFFFLLYLAVIRAIEKWFPWKTILREITLCMEEFFQILDKGKKRYTSQVLRGILWTVILLFAAFIGYRTQVGSRKIIRYLQLGIFILLLLLGHQYSNLPKRRMAYKNQIVVQYTWILLCIWLMISDFFVQKKCQFAGIILFVAGGYLLHQILYRDCIKQVFQEFMAAFWIVFLAALLFRGYIMSEGMWKISEPHGLREYLTVWKRYLLNMNLLGHGSSLFAAGRRILSYNGILRIGYVYGSIAILPYLMIWYGILRQGAVCFLGKKKEIAWFISMILIFLCSMVVNAL